MQFSEQPRIFDGDYRLLGEVGNKFYLFFIESDWIVSCGADGTNDLVAKQHGREDHGIEPEIARKLLGCSRRCGIAEDGRELHGLLEQHSLASHCIVAERSWISIDQPFETRVALHGGHFDDSVVQ